MATAAGPLAAAAGAAAAVLRAAAAAHTSQLAVGMALAAVAQLLVTTLIYPQAPYGRCGGGRGCAAPGYSRTCAADTPLLWVLHAVYFPARLQALRSKRHTAHGCQHRRYSAAGWGFFIPARLAWLVGAAPAVL